MNEMELQVLEIQEFCESLPCLHGNLDFCRERNAGETSGLWSGNPIRLPSIVTFLNYN